MKILVLKEADGETRVALTPQVAAKLVKAGHQISLEAGAGELASFSDSEYQQSGASIAQGASDGKAAEVLLAINPPSLKRLKAFGPGKTLLCKLNSWEREDYCQQLSKLDYKLIALEQIPRISRAQSMDILSSQANIAGYRAVVEAFARLPRAVPMMTTAAGTIRPAKAFIMGVGVAGLQAIATAKRMGAIVSATDVRPATKEQVESLAAKFVAVEDDEFRQAQTASGYAKPMSAEYQAKQAELIAKTIASQDVVITTALIPGRQAPTLVSQAMVESMKPGSVICDLAAEAGGNCQLTQAGKVVQHQGVNIIGYANWAGLVPQSTSELFANNLFNFLQLINQDGALHLNLEDEIVAKSLYEKRVLHN